MHDSPREERSTPFETIPPLLDLPIHRKEMGLGAGIMKVLHDPPDTAESLISHIPSHWTTSISGAYILPCFDIDRLMAKYSVNKVEINRFLTGIAWEIYALKSVTDMTQLLKFLTLVYIRRTTSLLGLNFDISEYKKRLAPTITPHLWERMKRDVTYEEVMAAIQPPARDP